MSEILKQLKKRVTETNSHKKARNTKFNNFCYLRTSFDLKIQDKLVTKGATKYVGQNFVKSIL